MENDIIFGSCRVVSPSSRALYITSIGWVVSMNLGVVVITLSFFHRLVMLPLPMEPLLMPPMSHICTSLHVESMMPMFSHHFPYSLVWRKFNLSQSFLSYVGSACRPFPILLLVCAHIVWVLPHYTVLLSTSCCLMGDALMPSFQWIPSHQL